MYVVSGNGIRTQFFPVAKFVASAFAGVPLEKMRSVSHRNGDFTNYSYRNLVPVFYKKK